MHLLDANRNRIELDPLREPLQLEARAESDALASESPLVKAGRAFFGAARRRSDGMLESAARPGPPATAFRERDTGLVRTFKREIAIRFRAGTSEPTQTRVLGRFGLALRRRNPFVADQLIAFDASRARTGDVLLEVANECAALDEVLFATPNFVSQYRRGRIAPPAVQWHLENLGKAGGQLKGEDVDALGAWLLTHGDRDVVVAVLDDGVDVEHPLLRRNVWRNPSRSARDQVGRDFFLPDDDPDHYNPRPKKFRYPYDDMAGNDIHGTPCAGVIAATGKAAYGIAPGARVLAVKVFHADEFAADERVADAMRYAATRADVLSCSWSGGASADVQLALEDVKRLGRRGLGSAVFCATGNESQAGRPARVGFPARDRNAIGVGASTDQGELASYSNVGSEVDFVAPSSGGVLDIFTTDVSIHGRGFNVGRADKGGKDGLCTNDFGGTSSATPLAAGVAALVLSTNPKLSSDELRELLRQTADKIGSGYDAKGFSPRLGYGRVNAARAVEEARRRVPARRGSKPRKRR
jgi:subtilisin family serine protease